MPTRATPIRKEPRSPRRKAAAKEPSRISMTAMARAKHRRVPAGVPSDPFAPYQPPPGVLPRDVKPRYATDSAFNAISDWAGSAWTTSAFLEGTTFLGYPYLAQLAQRPEYRVASEVVAQDCTREWIEIKTKGDEDKSEKIKELEDELERLKLQKVCQAALEKDGQFGRSHIYLDTGHTDDKDELKLDVGDGRSVVSEAKVGKRRDEDGKETGGLKAIRAVEPMWAYPTRYESSNPLSPDWYNPTSWGVMSQEIHRSRFLTIVGRPVPDLLKPAYAFGGLSMSQMMKPYVDNWLRTRQATSDLVASFVVNVLKTNLGTALQAGGEALFTRVDFFNAMRDNHGALVIDKDTEEWTNVQTSLASLDVIQAQSQEHMCSVTRIPVVKLLGIQPAGLNASSQGEIETYDDTIAAYQEKILRDPITTIMGFAQITLWGAVDPDITFDFKPLRQLTEKEEAELEKLKADTHDVYVAMGAVAPEDVQKKLASDEDSPYHGLDLTPPPEPMDPLDGDEPGGESGNLDDQVSDAVVRALRGDNDDSPIARAVADSVRTAMDAEFRESDHPRGQPDNPGQFGSGGGGGATPSSGKSSWRDLDFPSHFKGERYGKGAPLWIKASVIAAQQAGAKPLGELPRGTEVQGTVNTWALIVNTEDNKDDAAGAEAKFLLDHAKTFKFDEGSFKCKKGAAHYCYNNAYQAAMADPSLTYVEGIVQGGGVGAHAWVVDKSGKVIDPTIKNGKNVTAYIGVPIETEYLRKVTERERDKEQDHSKHWGVFTSKEYLEDDPSTFVKKGLGDPLPEPEDYTREGVTGGPQPKKGGSDTAFRESDHPRGQPDNPGQFGPGGGNGEKTKKSPIATAKTAHLTAASPDRSSWPSHIQSLKLPPAWTDVRISSNPDADLLATGRDAKGREQRVYAARFAESQQAAKFARIKALDRRIGSVTRRNEANLRSRDPATRELAACQELIMKMGLRPGSERETGAAETAYGATTLEGRHVVARGKETRLVFTGKKGVKLDLPVTDPALATELRNRAAKAGRSGRLFGDVSDDRLRRYVKTLGGDFKVKDFRTYLGTTEAARLVAVEPPPTSMAAYKRAVLNVAKTVAARLGNTPSIALKAYISPFVFAEWKHAAGVA
jgi:uncharacterized protein